MLAFNILHLVDADVIGKIQKLLKPGGRFISITPCLGIKNAMRVFAAFLRFVRVLDVRVVTFKELETRISNRFRIKHKEIMDDHLLYVAAEL